MTAHGPRAVDQRHSTNFGSIGVLPATDRVHSRYRRHLADLPIAGRPVRVAVLARPHHQK
jgi:hypothetical protein